MCVQGLGSRGLGSAFGGRQALFVPRACSLQRIHGFARGYRGFEFRAYVGYMSGCLKTGTVPRDSKTP